MKSSILIQQARESIEAATDLDQLERRRIDLLGRSGVVSNLLREIGKLPPEERRDRGAEVNAMRADIEAAFTARSAALNEAAMQARLRAERVDVTLPVRPAPPSTTGGSIHPINQTIDELVTIFGAMEFSVRDGSDIETEWHNFSALNIPDHHPARQDQDTFYLPGGTPNGRRLLRTQMSPIQIRTLLSEKPPLRIIAPGRTYRADHDATHSPMFHQVEGLVIDHNITLGHLKGCLLGFLTAFFGFNDLSLRYRSSYFPFTEPSMEIDIAWDRETGTIGGNDWLEILGAGMVHPRVLANCGLDPRKWQGFAFGMGIERITMVKHGMPDLRPFYESDIRWLRHYAAAPFE